MNVICQFCQQTTAHVPLAELTIYGIQVYYCYTCKAEYLTRNKEKPFSTSLYHTINGQMFRFTSLNNLAYIYKISEPGIPGKKINKNISHIKSFGPLSEDKITIPHITPSNIHEKLSIYLTFL